MHAIRISLIITSLILSFTAMSPAFAKKDLPAIDDDGMELVKDTDLETVYVDPNANLSNYNRVMLLDATVAFKKNWKRNQNGNGNPLRVKDKDMLEIQQGVAETLREVFTEELVESGYEMAEEPGQGVLLIKPAIVDLDVAAPDIQDSTFSRSYSDSAGEMTLDIELFDSLTNDKIARATDRQRDIYRGYVQWRTTVSNRQDAARMMRTWAKALTSALDEARDSRVAAVD